MRGVEVVRCHAELGEGPVWDTEARPLLGFSIRTIDPPLIRRPEATRLLDDTGGHRDRWRSAAAAGWSCSEDRVSFDPERQSVHGGRGTGAGPSRTNRFNDGKTDRQGRFWAGSSMIRTRQWPTGGSSFSIRTARAAEWSMASTPRMRLPSVPTAAPCITATAACRTVWAWDFHAAERLTNRRVFIELPKGRGGPDGAAV